MRGGRPQGHQGNLVPIISKGTHMHGFMSIEMPTFVNNATNAGHIMSHATVPTFAVRCWHVVEVVEIDSKGDEVSAHLVNKRPISTRYVDPSVLSDAVAACSGLNEGTLVPYVAVDAPIYTEEPPPCFTGDGVEWWDEEPRDNRDDPF